MLKNRVASNAAWIIGCRVAQSVLSLVVGMLTARYLGPANYGTINYAASLTAFVLPFMQLGLNSILVQEIINHPEKEGETIGTTLFMCTGSAMLCIFGIFTFSAISSADDEITTLICVLYSSILLFQAVEMLRYWFQAKLLSKYTSLVVLAAYFIISGYRIALLVLGKSIFWFAVSNSFDSLLIAIALLFFYKKLGGQKLQLSFIRAKEMFSRSWYFILSSLMITVFAQTDKIMLKLYLGEEAIGYYSAAVTCASYTGFIFTAILDSARPTILESKKNNQALFEKKTMQLYSIVVFISFGQCILMTLFSNEIISVLFGKGYYPASNVLKVVVWFTTFSYIGGVRSIWILAENLQKYLWKIHLFGAIANVILNSISIPAWGMYGAAIASIITQILINIVAGYIIPPMRKNNELLLESLNPNHLVELCKVIKRKR